jgi:hypothetical protein
MKGENQDLRCVQNRTLHSKLEPYRETIRTLRRKGLSYRQIKAHFQQQYDIHAAISTFHSFVKVRARHHKRTAFEILPPDVPQRESDCNNPIARLAAKPVLTAKAGKLFEYDGGPLEPTPQEAKNE